MRIIILCNNQLNQIALVYKVATEFKVVGVVYEERIKRSICRTSFLQLMNKALDRTLFISIRNAWLNLMNYYSLQYSHPAEVKYITVPNINSVETVKFINQLQPDLIIVSGTSIIKKKILELKIPIGIINLHTGLSPYIKGGPNCTNWCLSNNKPYLIGNTVMWMDAGIDSGDLIATEITKFDGSENLNKIHIKVMEHAHELYLKCLRSIQKDFENYPSVKQSCMTEGVTYYTKEWGFKPKLKLLINLITGRFRRAINKNQYYKSMEQIKTIPLYKK